jgi:hypothetical protein
MRFAIHIVKGGPAVRNREGGMIADTSRDATAARSILRRKWNRRMRPAKSIGSGEVVVRRIKRGMELLAKFGVQRRG